MFCQASFLVVSELMSFRLLSQASLHSKDKCPNQSLIFSEDLCTMWHSIIHDYYVVVYYSSIVLDTIINLLTCPFVIALKACFITAVKTKRRLQTMHNIMILLACLAVTDLLVGSPAIRTRPLNLNYQSEANRRENWLFLRHLRFSLSDYRSWCWARAHREITWSKARKMSTLWNTGSRSSNFCFSFFTESSSFHKEMQRLILI